MAARGALAAAAAAGAGAGAATGSGVGVGVGVGVCTTISSRTSDACSPVIGSTAWPARCSLGSEAGSAITSVEGLAATETSTKPAAATSEIPDSTPRVRVGRAEADWDLVNTRVDVITEW
jgi:hypothetical protein